LVPQDTSGGGDAARFTALVAFGDQVLIGAMEGLWTVKFANLEWKAERMGQVTGSVLALAAGKDKLYFATSEGVFCMDNTLANPQSLPGLVAGTVVTSLYVAINGDVLAGTLAHGIWRYSDHAWQPVYTPPLPGSVRLAAHEKALLSFAQPVNNPHGQIRINVAGVVLRHVAQPGFPLKIIQPDGNGKYDLAQGPVILVLENQGNSPATVTVQPPNANGVVIN
jgi:ligand-binding sensor domain-containing protein